MNVFASNWWRGAIFFQQPFCVSLDAPEDLPAAASREVLCIAAENDASMEKGTISGTAAR